MRHAVGDGDTDPAALVAALADERLRATAEQLRDAFGAYADLHPVYRQLVRLTLDELVLIEDHLAQLDHQESAGVNDSHRCPNGNRQMRRVLNQTANAAVTAKGTIFAIVSDEAKLTSAA